MVQVFIQTIDPFYATVLENMGKTRPHSLRISMIIKILTLAQNPELVRELFGKTATFKDLEMSTMLELK
jgi:hypothetical protein